MSTNALHFDLAPSVAMRRPVVSRLVRAEVLKLRRRRGLMALMALLTVIPIVLTYGAATIAHLVNSTDHGPAGGLENLAGPVEILSMLAGVGAILLGVTAGAADLNACVFRELVVTGRSRRQLFLARVPAGLAVLLSFVLVAYAVAAASAVAFAGSLDAPGAGDILGIGAWLVLSVTVSYTLALGIASLVGSRTAAITGLLAWNMVVTPLLLAASFLGVAREGLLTGALYRLSPESVGIRGDVDISLGAALAAVVVWTVVPLVLGAWRTETRDV